MDRPLEHNVPSDDHASAEAYLELLKACLTRRIAPEKYGELREPPHLEQGSPLRRRLFWRGVLPPLRALFARYDLELVRRMNDPGEMRELGHDWPAEAETMIGTRRLDNLHHCVRDVLRRGVPGDLIETGVWRGGATIFMRGALKAYGDATRAVWVADSFEGLPKPNEKFAADREANYWKDSHWLAVPLEEVRENFRRYSLLDERVRFLKGWFKDTLPNAGIDQLAVMRLDGDMYESTMDALVPLYPRLSSGGYCIIDDYAFPACRAAVEDFRTRENITETIQQIDYFGAFWQKS
jgi:O-methyltransferase